MDRFQKFRVGVNRCVDAGSDKLSSGIEIGSTWNPGFHKEMAEIVSKQALAVGAMHSFAPVLDISRDSRFGRQGETYGEDPALASAMGTAYVSGLQNDGELKEGANRSGD
ncbi:glycoside hydrolase family 3 N-terminal domain-containing protein [Paenibacillus sp. LHD-38]|uniref:glycoside hydrolase family 3 N-terminal domain-containing protein n=1 Tax=Paenibacillus sp. LHD-38 TaxID=3072143 RepID=UPI00280CF64D|nr:glycoside hydrolase family 3 N-terminal domain-containing protein [Paenibacillus sp. LHD-38]MDQ8736487.1 glycoside hydrolase family 3 N-terminal domain-containing protein [Paenibacillus sp. LHD-38]